MIRAESVALYASQHELAAASGVSVRTVEELLAGRRSRYRDQTLRGIETALGWEADSVARVVEGAQPVRKVDPLLARIREVWPKLSARDRRLIAALVDVLTRE